MCYILKVIYMSTCLPKPLCLIILLVIMLFGCFSDKSDLFEMEKEDDVNVLLRSAESTISTCTDEKDNDDDDQIDCADSDCYGIALCMPEMNCDDDRDNDEDGETDCDDSDCFYTPTCFLITVENTYEMCTDKVDNDKNGKADCNDPSCSRFEHCIENTVDACTDEIDNDEDDLVDCDDPGCAGIGVCLEVSDETCSDEEDNDADGYVDCQDPGCAYVAACLPEMACDDDIDNDHDGLKDCLDPDCNFAPACVSNKPVENTFILCSDENDNDNDGFTDCEDSDCSDFSICQENTNAACSDTFDNDDDGLVDCNDEECMVLFVCNEGNSISCVPDDFVPPATVDFELTVYDYEGGVEFGGNQGCPDERLMGMVADKMVDGRPVFLSNECENSGIGTWWDESGTVAVIDTTLTFEHKGNNVYHYKTHKVGFFPAGGCDAGTGGSSGKECKSDNINYGFAAHMHREFTYIREGADDQTFDFSGDDDVFVFLNSHLVLDIGGIHNPIQEEFNLKVEGDKIGLVTGDKVSLDFFIAERNPTGSQAQITMNMPCLIAAAFEAEDGAEE